MGAQLGHDIEARVYGPELMERACARAAGSGQRFYLYGGRDEQALAQLTANLLDRHPDLQLAGGLSPPFRELTDAELDDVAARINAARPDVVWVGIGVPKQEKWMAAMRERLDAPVLIGVGAAFDFHAGLVPQAPAWMQRRGLEWLFRLLQEPRRLWKRYARHNPRFVAGFARQWASHRRGRACPLACGAMSAPTPPPTSRSSASAASASRSRCPSPTAASPCWGSTTTRSA